jgi:hypothetical protein
MPHFKVYVIKIKSLQDIYFFRLRKESNGIPMATVFHLETTQMAGSGRPGCLAVNRTCKNIMLVFQCKTRSGDPCHDQLAIPLKRQPLLLWSTCSHEGSADPTALGITSSFSLPGATRTGWQSRPEEPTLAKAYLKPRGSADRTVLKSLL